MSTLEKLPIGAKIRFTKDLIDPPSGDHPGRLFAAKGGIGRITGHCKAEGYWVKWCAWPMADFGASEADFDLLEMPE